MIRIIIASFVLLISFSSLSMAIPYLQLDIMGGMDKVGYDVGDESIYTKSDVFTLYAFANPGGELFDENGNPDGVGPSNPADTLADTFYLSIAIVPKSATTTDFGSFDINGATKDTSDMIYGIPPSMASENPHLGPHGIYETLYYEQSFKFVANKTTAAYNTQDYPGATKFDSSKDEMFYMDFALDVSDMGNYLAGVDIFGEDIFKDFELHFDLYDLKTKKDGFSRGYFAPFSHDAKTIPAPEPSTLILLVLGLVGLAAYRRKRH